MTSFYHVKSSMTELGKVINFLLNFEKRILVYPIVLGVMIGLTPLVGLLATRALIDDLSANAISIQVIKYIIFIVLSVFIKNIAENLLQTTMRFLAFKVTCSIRFRISEIYTKLDMKQAESEEIIKNKEKSLMAIEQQDSVTNFLISGTNFISAAVTFVGTILLFGELNILIITVLLAAYITNNMIAHKKRAYEFSTWEKWTTLNMQSRAYNSMAHEYSYAKDLRIYQAQKIIKEKIHECDAKRTTEMLLQSKQFCRYDGIRAFIDLLQNYIIYLVFTYLLLIDKISLADFTLYIGNSVQFLSSLTQFQNMLIDVARYSKLLIPVLEFIDTPFAKQNSKIALLENVYDIEFENVTFKYADTQSYALKNLSIRIKSGETICIVGPNGSGKSTFIKLMTRVYKPDSGTIRINGIDINEYSQKALDSIFSILYQEHTVYPVSIRNNVTLNSEDSSSLYDLYDQVDICDLISSLENGDKTIMSAEFKDSTVFSGGQKLKLLLARIMYNDAHILILDEPSAALDPLAEFEFYDLFQNISAQKTSIYISHRMLATKYCSRVLVFDNGHIIEDGSFEELLHNDGLFRKMYMSQSSVFQQEN